MTDSINVQAFSKREYFGSLGEVATAKMTVKNNMRLPLDTAMC